MAKKLKKFFALVLALTLCLVQMAVPAMAAPGDWWPGGGWHPGYPGYPGGGNNEPNQIEYYEVYLQGNLIASASSNSYYFLGTHYTAGASVNGNTLSWYINPVGGDSGNFGGSVNLTDYIVIPEGFTVSKFNVAESTVDGVNDPNTYMYDNCIIHITIETIYNEETGEELPVEPTPAATSVTVNHNYFTEDLYTGETVSDGSATSSFNAVEHDAFTASPVTGYNGNEYAMTTDASALTITVVADAAQNVININYLRTIDTTPVDYEAQVSVSKTADKPVYEEGETITWTIIVTNDGEDAAYDVFVTDPMTDDSWIIEVLNAGDSKTYTTTSEAAEAGTVTNSVSISWTDGDEIDDAEEEDEAKNASAEASVEVAEPTPEPKDYEPSLTVSKTADKETYEIGDLITWTITVTNDSEYTAYDITVIDELVGKSWAVESLAPGASETFTATMVAEEVGELTNSVEINWNDNDDLDDAEEDEITNGSDEITVKVEEPVEEPTEEPTEAPTEAPTEPVTPPVNPPVENPTENEEPAPAPAPQAPQQNQQPQEQPQQQVPQAGAMLVDIIDEDVPLADVPETGDISLLWVTLSLLSGSGAFILKRKED